jgi:pimeloyl-ACP methyl ester carboxylesterase
MAAAQVNGISIEYDVRGDEAAEPLLLVMGLGGQLIAWPDEFVDRLAARGFRVIRYDNRDVGLSTKIDAPAPTRRRLILSTISPRFAKAAYSLDDMANDALGLLDHLGVARAHVVGVSMGGMIAQLLAIRHADRVASLTSIMSTAGDRKRGKAKASLLRQLGKLSTHDPEEAVEKGVAAFRLISGPHFDEAAVREMTKAAVQRSFDPDGTARQMMAIAASLDRTAGLGSVKTPTLVIHGLLDRLATPSGGIATANAIPGARLVMFPDMGHDLPRPRWDEIIDEITANARRAGAPANAGGRGGRSPGAGPAA